MARCRSQISETYLPRRPEAEVKMSEIDLERALNDPAGLFRSPDEVVHHPGSKKSKS